MSTKIQNKIKNKIVEPIAKDNGMTSIAGVVKETNEGANNCTVSFIDNNGAKQVKANVPVLISNKGFISWFPKQNDNVLLQYKNDILYVVGPTYNNFESIRKDIKVEKDILTSTFTDTMGGYIF